MLQLEGEC